MFSIVTQHPIIGSCHGVAIVIGYTVCLIIYGLSQNDKICVPFQSNGRGRGVISFRVQNGTKTDYGTPSPIFLENREIVEC